MGKELSLNILEIAKKVQKLEEAGGGSATLSLNILELAKKVQKLEKAGGGGGGDIDLSKIKVAEIYNFETGYSNADCMRAIFYKLDIYGDTDYKASVWEYTAEADCTLIFPDWSKGFSNTGSNDGYVSVEVNGEEKAKTYLTTNTATDLDFTTTIDLKAGDTVNLYVGFDNEHTNVKFFVQTVPVIILN